MIETDAALKELKSEKAKTISQFIADNENKLADASRKADEAREALAKASARLDRTTLYAPIDGVVQQMAVTTIGQVVTTGQQLAVHHAERRQAPGRGAGRQSRHRFRQARATGGRQGGRLPVHPLRRPERQGGQDRVGRDPRAGGQAGARQRRRRRQCGAEPPTTPGQPEIFVFPFTVALDQTAMNIDDACSHSRPA